MTKTCYIFGAGAYGNLPCPAVGPDDLVIAADGGYAWLTGHGLTPRLAVGDFDSLGYVPEGLEVLRHPPEKDDTDMALAVEAALARGCTRFFLYGGLGGRLDHSVANFHILAQLAQLGCGAFLVGPQTCVAALGRGRLTFSPAHRGMISIFSWGGDATGVTLTGLKYPLIDGTLTCDRALGVSNEFLGQAAEVSAQQGTLLVMWQQAADTPFPRFQ